MVRVIKILNMKLIQYVRYAINSCNYACRKLNLNLTSSYGNKSFELKREITYYIKLFFCIFLNFLKLNFNKRL